MPEWLLELLKNGGITAVFVLFLIGLWKIIVWFKINVATPLTEATLSLLKTLREESPKQTATLAEIKTNLEKIETQLGTQEQKFDEHVAVMKEIGAQSKQQTENLSEHRQKLIDKLDDQANALGQQTDLLRGIKENSGTNLEKLTEISESMDGVKDIAVAQAEHRKFAEKAVKDIGEAVAANAAKLTDHDMKIAKAIEELDERKRRNKH